MIVFQDELFTPKKIKVKYHADIDRLEFVGGKDKSNWIDLRAAETIKIDQWAFEMIPLGISMELPDGFEAYVAPRSSTFKKYGILMANSLGIIDSSFRGENDQWMFPAYAVRDTVIPKNDRIAQFRIIERQPDVEFVTVEHLGSPDRGGIGSTGRK